MSGVRHSTVIQSIVDFDGEVHKIPGYRIKGLLGHGGMATVYLAEQINLGRDVALKVMAPQYAASPDFAERFLAEGRMTARLNHPNIVTVHDVGQHLNLYYLATEFLPGGTLKERLPGLTNLVDKLRILRGIARGLGYAHEHKIVHRDVKTANIMFRDEAQPVVTDFGIAKSLESSQILTQIGGIIGTPHYMSPEQAQGQPLDGRSDLYALGIMMYEVLVGSVPFDAPMPLTILYLHVFQQPPSLPNELAALQSILDRLLAKLPEQRFQTAADFSTALEPFLGKLKTGRVTVVTPMLAPNTILVASEQLVTEPAQNPTPKLASFAVPLEVKAPINDARYHPASTSTPPNDALSALINIPGGYSNAVWRTEIAPKKRSAKAITMGMAACTLAFAIAWGVYSVTHSTEKTPLVQNTEQPDLNAAGDTADESRRTGDTADASRDSESIRTELLSAVRSHMARGALIEPADNCALALVSRILEQAPADPLALSLLKEIGAGLSAQIRERWAAGKRSEALILLRAGLDKLPNDLELNRTRANLQLELDSSPPPTTPVPALNTNDVAELLKYAETLFGRSQWTTPEGDNAVDVLNRVLALEPNQPQAMAMLEQIAKGYENVALTWRDRGRPDQALAQVRNGLKAQPTNARLLRLEQQLMSP